MSPGVRGNALARAAIEEGLAAAPEHRVAVPALRQEATATGSRTEARPDRSAHPPPRRMPFVNRVKTRGRSRTKPCTRSSRSGLPAGARRSAVQVQRLTVVPGIEADVRIPDAIAGCGAWPEVPSVSASVSRTGSARPVERQTLRHVHLKGLRCGSGRSTDDCAVSITMRSPSPAFGRVTRPSAPMTASSLESQTMSRRECHASAGPAIRP